MVAAQSTIIFLGKLPIIFSRIMRTNVEKNH